MNDIEKLLENGFFINSDKPDIKDLALISLKVALNSYFSTYRSFEHRIRMLRDDYSATQEEINFAHSTAYFESSSECIIHFQHFAELTCKTFLRTEHPMLADNILKNPSILHSLINNNPLTDEEKSKLSSVEFSEALNRLNSLVSSKKIKDHSALDFIKKHHTALISLNNLRNRIWHRGLYILEYRTLDKFIGSHILPFVVDVMAHPSYSDLDHRWKPKHLSCAIDPIMEIINHFANDRYNAGKVSLLKELGRAAYNNRLSPPIKGSKGIYGFLDIVNNQTRSRAERIAAGEASRQYNKIDACPVCGVMSLVIEEETDHDEDPVTGEPKDFWRFTHSVTCENCTFSIGDEIENASAYGFTSIKDFFHSEKF